MKLYGLDKPIKTTVKKGARVFRPRRGVREIIKPSINLEETFALHVRGARLPAPTREYRFSQDRNWKVDFAWPEMKLAVEIEGGTYKEGRHVRPEGFRKDCIKYNALALAGWTLLRGDCRMVKDLTLLGFVEKAIKSYEEQNV